MRAVSLAPALLLGLFVASAWSATPAAPAPTPATANSAPSAAAALDRSVTVTDLQNLVNTLQNTSDRDKLIQQLQALIAAQHAAASPEQAKTVTASNIIEGLSTRFQGIGGELLDVAGIARGAPRLVGWVEAQAQSPPARMRWLQAFFRLIVVLAAAVLAGFFVGRLLRPWRSRLIVTPGDSFGRWLVLFVAALVLNWLPLAVFTAIATLVLAALHPDLTVRLLVGAAISAILRAEAILIALRVILISPVTPRFLSSGEETRSYLYIWSRRFVIWPIYGFAVANLTLALGAPGSIQALLLRFTTIVLAGLAIVFVLQNRAPVAAWLRSDGDRTPRSASRITGGTVRTLRNTLAETWHILAIVYIVGSFGSYMVDLHGGATFVLRATVLSIVVLIATGLIMRLIRHLDRRGFTLNDEFRTRFPGLETRSNKYLPVMIFIVSGVVYALAILLLLQAWGVESLAWLEAQYVRRAAGSLVSIAIVVVLAIALWEVIRAAVERTLGGSDASRQAMVSARLRTLLPLVRSTVLIAIVAIAGFIVLSQIGVDIAPLLAGAGIVGIAVGLGSQQLVKDVINGLFILMENTVTIGDYVDVGGGHAGTVEDISIRSMRLRDGSGAVHTVPFSSVGILANTNRGIGNAAFAIEVAAGEDTDRVSRLLGEIGAELRRDQAFAARMLSDFQLWGVDKVSATAVTISGQIVCTDAGRWPVQREFNRRMKLRFEQEHIAFALPTQSVVLQGAETQAEIRPDGNRQVTPLRVPRDRA